MKPKLLNANERLMSEMILMGGEVLTRAAAMQQLQAEGVPRGAIDWAVFSVPPLSDEELRWLAYRDLVLALRCRVLAKKGSW